MKKRILSLVLTLTMVASICAFMPLNVSAKTNGYTQEKAVKYINSMIGTKYDVSPKNNSYDCVDLANEYYHVVGGQDYKARGNGGDFCSNALPSGWERHYISNGYTPQAGDVVSWAAKGGWAPYGHVALVLSVSPSDNTITVVEQSTSRQISASKATYKWSSPTCYIHPDFVPSTPTIKSKSDVTSTSAKLSWNEVSGATKYKLEYRKAGGSWDDATSKTTSDTSYTVKGLESGKLYWFRLYAGNDYGWSDKSENYGVYLKPNKPVARKTGSPGSIKLEWTNSGGNTKYAIYVRKSGEVAKEDSEYAIMLEDQYAYTFTGLTPGAQYYFKVKEYNMDDPSVVSGRSDSGTNFTKLNKPTIMGITANSVSLSWQRDVMDGTYTYTYIVRRGPANAGGPENALNSYYNITDHLSGSSYHDTNVSQGTSYDYYIDVYRTKDGQIEWCDNSEVVTVTTNVQEATGINISTGNISLKQGESYSLSATVYPDNANNKTVIWSSGDNNIATVGSDGTVTAINVGNTNIYARTVNGYEAVCNITVNRRHTVLDLGDDFNAYINYEVNGKYVTREENSDVQLRSYSGKLDQIWRFVKQNDGSYKILSLANNDCNVLDVYDCGYTSGTNVATYYDNDNIEGHSSSNQRWYIVQSQNGYRLKPQCSECMLDVNGGGDASDGTNIQIWEYLDYGAQEFYINKINSNDVLMDKIVEYKGHFYQVCYVPGLTWNGANTYAQRMGGHLVTISDEAENDFIAKELLIEGKEFFIGLNDIWNESSFTWVNGESTTYYNWADGEPNNMENNEDAAAITTKGKWYDCNANIAYDSVGFIIEYEPQVESEFEYNGHKYQVYSVVPNWETAKEYCEQLGGYLTTITSSEENSVISEHLTAKGYYIGASLSKTEANWQWENDEHFSFSNWNADEPNNVNETEYVVETSSDGLWNVVDNSSNLVVRGFICEIELPYTLSKVYKIDNTYSIVTTGYGIKSGNEIIIAGYVDGKLIDIKSTEYNSDTITTQLVGNIDEIKVMVWNCLSTLKPLCDAELIQNKEFIIE